MTLEHVVVGDPEAEHLLVLLHGYGDDPADIMRLVTRLDPEGEYLVVAPRGPHAAGGGAAWFEHEQGVPTEASITASLSGLSELVAETRPHADAGVAVVGFSQGGAMALAWAVLGDAAPGRVACLNGYLPELEHLGGDLGSMSGRQVLVQAGRADEVVDADLVQMGADALTAAGAEVTFQLHEDGHTTSSASAVAVGRWLSSNRAS